MKKSILLILACLLALPAFAAKPRPRKPAAQKAAAPAKESDAYFKDVVTYPGASKIPVLAKQAILIDYDTKKVLLEKRADERMIPSSMTKMMTSYLIEEKLKKGELNLQSSFPVSQRAWQTQGSKMFVPLGQMVKVDDLLRGIIVQSGNDACVVAAEGISGGEVQFAAEMNAMATKLGLTSTKFKNASGLPEDDHYSTARDLAKLSAAVVKDHPEYYKYYQEKDFTYNNIKQGNRNPLLYDNMGCDGIKTGHTEAGGYAVAASCLDGTQRYILVIGGLDSMQARADEARKLMNWAKENFVKKLVFKKGDVVQSAVPLELGVKASVPAVASKDVELLLLRTEQSKFQTKVVSSKVQAPIKKGDKVGKVIVSTPLNSQEVTIVSAEACEKLGIVKRALRYIGIGA